MQVSRCEVMENAVAILKFVIFDKGLVTSFEKIALKIFTLHFLFSKFKKLTVVML